MIYNVANQKNAFSKAEKEQLNQNIEELKSKDEALNNEIETLKSNKANQSELENLTNRVSGTEQNIIGLNNNKADRTELNDKITQTQLTNALNSKANKWDSVNGFNAGSSYQLMDANGKIPNERLKISDNAQIGDIRMTQADAIYKPDGSVDNTWLPCNGDIVNKELYPEYAEIALQGLFDSTIQNISLGTGGITRNTQGQFVYLKSSNIISFSDDLINWEDDTLDSGWESKYVQARVLYNKEYWCIISDYYNDNNMRVGLEYFCTPQPITKRSTWSRYILNIGGINAVDSYTAALSENNRLYFWYTYGQRKYVLWNPLLTNLVNQEPVQDSLPCDNNQNYTMVKGQILNNKYFTTIPTGYYHPDNAEQGKLCYLVEYDLQSNKIKVVELPYGLQSYYPLDEYQSSFNCYRLSYYNNIYFLEYSTNTSIMDKVNSIYKFIPGHWEVQFGENIISDNIAKSNWAFGTTGKVPVYALNTNTHLNFIEGNLYTFNYITDYGYIWIKDSDQQIGAKADLDIIGHIYPNLNNLSNNKSIYAKNLSNKLDLIPYNTMFYYVDMPQIQKIDGQIQIFGAMLPNSFTLNPITPLISLSHISSGFADINTFQKISQ